MIKESHVKITLLISVVFNFSAAYLMAFPAASLSQKAGLPGDVPLLYSNLISFVIVYFGMLYAWLAVQPQIERHLLFLGGLGKVLFFAVVFLTFIFGHVSLAFTSLTVGDLIFGCIWLHWLNSTRSVSNV